MLGYVICCVLRLARFNVSNKQGDEKGGDFFVGIPSPAGAMLPMYVSFLFSDMPLASPVFIAGYILIIGFLMISRVPTYSFKNLSIYRKTAKFWVLGVALLLSALLTYLWATLVFITLVYVAGLFQAFRAARKPTI